jgi:hypothetical protein
MRAVQVAFAMAMMSSAAVAGPFGIAAGTPVSQLKVFSRSGDLLTISVPQPDAEFEAYQVWAPPGVGVCKLIAIGKTEDSDGDGSDTRAEYAALKAMLARSFGKPESYEYLHTGARWKDDRDWVMSLWQRERTQTSFWGTSGGPLNADDVGAIELETKASSANSSYNSVGFEFTNFSKCAAAQAAGRKAL